MSFHTPSIHALELRDVTKTYGPVHALDRVSLQVPRGSFFAVMGPSGSGKSTLLQCAAGLDTPTSGQVVIGGREISGLNETERTLLRRGAVGFVFQSYNLLPSLSVEENIRLPLRVAGTDGDDAWLAEVIDRIGLRPFLRRRPAELSGGQQQRVAIARSLAARPEVVFADEPTGALDARTASEVLGLLRDLVDDVGQTVVMVTHDPLAAHRAHATVVMDEGRIQDYLVDPTPEMLAGTLVGAR
ncbi:ABC transporter ATP-binding protein [Mumia sp. zg.B17]|uniref:ABC transporter ATP-binding protein n=1 Tax=Mumia sp. zg.B17 TaxID=2855446 RepID=UPI001C6E0A0C|nr:ABC transporter ATP-binding protein [Mumia sp. zg.B17]MBW9206322.1 ABC transporter ATP-binding protein [Mumia sp. zg.B17]